MTDRALLAAVTGVYREDDLVQIVGPSMLAGHTGRVVLMLPAVVVVDLDRCVQVLGDPACQCRFYESQAIHFRLDEVVSCE